MENSERRLWALANALPAMAFLMDAAGTIEGANAQALTYIGRSAESLAGSGWLDAVHPDDRERAQAVWRRAVERRERYEQELRLRRHDGRFRWHLCHAEPVCDQAGSLVEWVGACTDIQASKEARWQSGKQFVEAVDRVPIGIGVANAAGRTLYLNPAGLKLHGFSSLDEMLVHLKQYRDVFELLFPDGRLMPVENWPMSLAMSGEYVSEYEVRLRRAGFDERWVSYSTVPVHGYGEEGPRFIFIMHDMTERTRSEAALRASEARLQAIIDNSPVVLFIKDLGGRYMLANSAYLRLFDLTADQLLGITDHQRFSREVADAYRANDDMVIRSGVAHEFEETGFFNGEQRTYLSMKFPLRDEQGQVYGVCGISTDITEQKRQQQRLLDIDRRKDDFLSMLAHELRNPLAPISNAVQLLSLQEPGSQNSTLAVEIIDRQVKHLTHLVDDLLDIARINTGRIRLRRDVVELGELVRRSADNARPRMKTRGLEYAVAFHDEPLWLFGDPVRIVQVADNLLDNAFKYTPPGGTVRVDLRREGSHGILSVSDTGIGIEEASLTRIFELFEQGEAGLDHSGGGLGLGLHLVKRLVEKHGGSVAARSAGRGRGSEFIVRLPLIEHDAGTSRGAEKSQLQSGSTRRVLVVEDNRDAAETLEMLLKAQGHAVAVAVDGPQAIALAGEFAPEVALIDLGLPGMDGYEVARTLRTRFGGGTKLIALTGYGHQVYRDRSQAAGFDEHVVKPLTGEVLSRLLGPSLSDQ